MKAEGAQPLLEVLTAKKSAIVKQWLARTLQTYPEHTSRFLSQEKDAFRNPVGHALGEALPALFDQLVKGSDTATLSGLLDPILRIRAVQDFSAAQAVAFILALKQVVREALHFPPHPPLSPGYPLGAGEDTQRVPGEGANQLEALAILESRIDAMALLAFDLYMRCREQLDEIRANEAKRRLSVWERMHKGQAARGESSCMRHWPWEQ
jgi:hypothetical protein